MPISTWLPQGKFAQKHPKMSRKYFLIELNVYKTPPSPSSQLPIREDIKNLDPCDDKTFEGGCNFLLQWYRDNF